MRFWLLWSSLNATHAHYYDLVFCSFCKQCWMCQWERPGKAHKSHGLLFTVSVDCCLPFKLGTQNYASLSFYHTLHLQPPIDRCYQKLQVFAPLAQHMSHTSFDFQPRMQSIHLPREEGINNKFISASAGRLVTDAEAGSQARTWRAAGLTQAVAYM